MDLHASDLLGTRMVVGLRVPPGLVVVAELLLIWVLSKNTSLALSKGREHSLHSKTRNAAGAN